MFAKGNSASNALKCDGCGGTLDETARINHPRLPAHEIRVYACHRCGKQEQISAPTPFQARTP